MNHKERLRATLAGEAVDRIAASTWGHDFLREWTAEDLADHTIERQKKFELETLADYRNGSFSSDRKSVIR